MKLLCSYYALTMYTTMYFLLEKSISILKHSSIVSDWLVSFKKYFLISEYRVGLRNSYYVLKFITQTHFCKVFPNSSPSYYVLTKTEAVR